MDRDIYMYHPDSSLRTAKHQRGTIQPLDIVRRDLSGRAWNWSLMRLVYRVADILWTYLPPRVFLVCTAIAEV